MRRDSFRLLVFDWDGTLMDSIAAIVECTQAALRELELEPLPEERIRRAIGMGLRESVEEFYPGSAQEILGRVIERYRHHWLVTYKDHPVLFAGVEETLRALAGGGYLLAVATGKSRRGLDRELQATGLAPVFHASRTADEAPSKPHPQMLLDLMAELGAGPRETLMVGDTGWDLAMARNAGARAVAVLCGSHRRAELEEHAPLAVLERVSELPAWLAVKRAPARSRAASPSRRAGAGRGRSGTRGGRGGR
jgi:phosphoglycolate phosphatase